MEKHISKKLFAGMLALSAGFILASCDPVSALPSNYNAHIVDTTEGAIDLDDNNLGTIYDAISSDQNSKVVEKILSEIAVAKFGSYEDFLQKASSTDVEVQKAFIDDHEDVFVKKNEDGSRDGHELIRLADFVEDIKSRISEYFYNEITSGSYNDDLGRFDEKKLYNKHLYELYDLGEVSEFNVFFVDKTLSKENAFEKLHKGAYELVKPARGYIQEKVYPDILRNKLVENYIYNNNFNSLGRAYARKVNYVKISYDAESKFEENLLRKFADLYIESTAALDFEVLANAVKGFTPSTSGSTLISWISDTASSGERTLLLGEGNYAAVAEKEKVVVAANDKNYVFGDITLVPAGTYLTSTKIGKILKEYVKAIEAEGQGRFPSEEGKTALDSFMSDGKSKEYGLLQKITSLIKEDYTTDGWYVKNGGLSDLPSTIRDRLFNIRVANDLDSESLVNEDSAEKMGAYEYEDGDKSKNKLTRLPYLREIYGKKVILPSKSLSYDKDHYNYIYNDTSANALYICEVLEAPSTAKLAEKSEAYVSESEPIKREQIARQVAKVLGTKDSYIKDAYTEELNKFKDLKFYDTSLYEYLKSEYPDLDIFDED